MRIKRIKRTASILLGVMLTLCLMVWPGTAHAATPTTLTVAGTSVIDGEKVTYWLTNATTGSITGTTAAANDWTVKYDPTTTPAATLTLRGATVYHDSDFGAIMCDGGDLRIELEGTNRVGFDPSKTNPNLVDCITFNMSGSTR